jgi:hypothetical protein
VLVWLATVVGLLVWGAQVRQDIESHRAELAAPCHTGDPDKGTSRATLTAHGTTNTAVSFGRTMGTLRRHFEYRIEDPSGSLANARCVNVETGPFVRDSGDAKLGLIAVATGAVASFGILTATYLSSAAWDADVLRFIALTGSMFGAFVAAATTVAAAGADRSGA